MNNNKITNINLIEDFFFLLLIKYRFRSIFLYTAVIEKHREKHAVLVAIYCLKMKLKRQDFFKIEIFYFIFLKKETKKKSIELKETTKKIKLI